MGVHYYPHSVQEEGEPLGEDGEPSLSKEIRRCEDVALGQIGVQEDYDKDVGTVYVLLINNSYWCYHSWCYTCTCR